MSEQGTRGQRIYLIREALGTRRDPLPLEKFAALIAETTGVRYEKSVLSRKETGQIPVSIDDIEAISAVDPLKRGRAWLAGWDQEEGKDGGNVPAVPVPRTPRPIVNRTIDYLPPDQPTQPSKRQPVKRKPGKQASA